MQISPLFQAKREIKDVRETEDDYSGRLLIVWSLVPFSTNSYHFLSNGSGSYGKDEKHEHFGTIRNTADRKFDVKFQIR